MDARTNIKTKLPGRHLTGRASCRRLADTNRALENGAVAARGGSTNAALHPPAVAREHGIKFDLFDVAEIFKKTPCVAGLKRGGRYLAKDIFEIGGIPLLMKTLLDRGYRFGDCLAVNGLAVDVVDADVGTLNVKLTGAKPGERKTNWQARETNPTSGARCEYARQAGPAVDGAVVHPGWAHEKQCYADI